MRLIKVWLLVVLVNIPALICTLPLCAAELLPVERHCYSESPDTDNSYGVMTFGDCIQQHLTPWLFVIELEAPEFKAVTLVFSDQLSLQTKYIAVALSPVRGPPQFLNAKNTYPPVFLSTQRLRI